MRIEAKTRHNNAITITFKLCLVTLFEQVHKNTVKAQVYSIRSALQMVEYDLHLVLAKVINFFT